MADKALKVVIELAADAKGVRAGTQQAASSLERLQKLAGQVRSMAVVNYALDFARQIADGVQQEFQHITDAAHAYSPDAMRGQMALDMATQQSDQMLANAFGPIVEMIDKMKAQALIDVAQYFVDNKDAIGNALVSIADFGIEMARLTAEALVGFSNALTYLQNLMMGDPSKAAERSMAVAQAAPAGSTAMGAMWIYELLKEKLGGT